MGLRSCLAEEGIIIMNNEKGYMVLDCLAAFALCMMMIAYLLPLWLGLQDDRTDVWRKNRAYQLLYEHLERYRSTGEVPLSVHDRTYGSTYDTTIFPFPGNDSYVKGCVKYTDSKGRAKEVCDTAKRRDGFHAG